jgi:hypothetical protein
VKINSYFPVISWNFFVVDLLKSVLLLCHKIKVSDGDLLAAASANDNIKALAKLVANSFTDTPTLDQGAFKNLLQTSLTYLVSTHGCKVGHAMADGDKYSFEVSDTYLLCNEATDDKLNDESKLLEHIIARCHKNASVEDASRRMMLIVSDADADIEELHFF